MDSQLSDLLAEIDSTTADLARAVALVQAGTRAVNDIGRIASAVQREAQEVEFAPVSPALKQRVQDLVQRTGFVNVRAGELAGRLRELRQGLADLEADIAAVRSAAAAAAPVEAP